MDDFVSSSPFIMFHVFPYLAPKSLFRLLLTSPQNWQLPQSQIYGSALEEYFKQHFSSFVHCKFDWEHDKVKCNDIVCIRAVKKSTCEDSGNEYEFIVDAPTTGFEIMVVDGCPKQRWLLWRDAYNEVRQRTLLMRNLHREVRDYFHVGGEQWLRIKDFALSDAVCQTAVAFSQDDFDVRSVFHNGCSTKLKDLPFVFRLRECVDVTVYKRIIRQENQDPTLQATFGPLLNVPTKDELCKLWFLGATCELKIVAPSERKLVETGTFPRQQLYRNFHFSNEELLGALRKVNFAKTFGHAENFPLLGKLPFLRNNDIRDEGAHLCMDSEATVRNSSEWVDNSAPEIGPPPKSKGDSSGSSVDERISFKRYAISTRPFGNDFPLLPQSIFDACKAMTKAWLLFKINKIRLAILAIADFSPYDDGTVWEMSDVHTLPVFEEKVRGEHYVKPYYGNCNNVYIGPEGVLIVRYNAEGVDELAEKLVYENIPGFKVVPNGQIFPELVT